MPTPGKTASTFDWFCFFSFSGIGAIQQNGFRIASRAGVRICRAQKDWFS
jgi:hypothetical protein